MIPKTLHLMPLIFSAAGAMFYLVSTTLYLIKGHYDLRFMRPLISILSRYSVALLLVYATLLLAWRLRYLP